MENTHFYPIMKTTAITFLQQLRSTYPWSIKPVRPADPLGVEIQRLEKLLTQEANKLKLQTRNSKTPSPLTQQQRLIDLAG